MSRTRRVWVGTALLIIALHGVLFLTFFKTESLSVGRSSQIFEIVGVRVLESAANRLISPSVASFVPKATPKPSKHTKKKAPSPVANNNAVVSASTSQIQEPQKAAQVSQAPDLTAGKEESVVMAARPVYAPRPLYPPIERRQGREGRVMLALFVDDSGRVSQTGVRESSGSEAFDQAALNAVKRWRFTPARDRDGRALSRWCTVRILFQMDR